MLFIFRKLRRSFFLPGKVRTYLAYAAGETLLVVIGILIALQINGWHEDWKNAEIEREIVSSLHDEFVQNKIILKGVTDHLSRTESSCYQLMELMHKDAGSLSEHNTNYLIYWCIQHTPFNPSNNVLSEMLQSGKLGLLQDQKLKSSLFDWDRLLNNSKSTFQIYEKFIEDQVMDYLLERIAIKNIDAYSPMQWDSPSKFDGDVHLIFQDRKYENIVDNTLYHISLLKGDYEAIEQILNDIIEKTKQ
jgi:hypothetical protein